MQAKETVLTTSYTNNVSEPGLTCAVFPRTLAEAVSEGPRSLQSKGSLEIDQAVFGSGAV